MSAGPARVNRLPRSVSGRMTTRGTDIALLDCYSGSNLGDAAIVDAAIANFRERAPDVQLTGISLSNYNMESRHGIPGVALCCTALPFYSMSNWSGSQGPSHPQRSGGGRVRSRIKTAMPGTWARLKWTYVKVMTIPRELKHFVQAWRSLRACSLLVVCGGGQIDDEWGGAWGHPFALLKWTLAARLAGTPVAVASVGVSRLRQRLSKVFIGAALRLVTYRSFRDHQSRELAAELLPSARTDAVVEDLAFAMPAACLPAPVGLREQSGGRRVIAIGPIAYARPGSWPSPDGAVYGRYLATMKSLIMELLDRGYFLLFVWSSMPDDRVALGEILAQLDTAERTRLEAQSSFASIEHGRWTDFAAAVQGVDLVIASRLHSVILALVLRKPPIAISFDPKVDRLMEDFGDPRCLLNIRDFTVGEVVDRVRSVERDLESQTSRIDEFLQGVSNRLADQFDRLVALSHGVDACKLRSQPEREH